MNLARTKPAHKYRFSYSRQRWVRLNESALKWIFAFTDCFCTVKRCIILRFECLVCLWNFRIHTDKGIFKRYLGINGFWIAYYSWCQHEWISDFVTGRSIGVVSPKSITWSSSKIRFPGSKYPKNSLFTFDIKITGVDTILFPAAQSLLNQNGVPFSLLNQNTCHLVTAFYLASFSTSQHTRANQNKAIEEFSWWAVVNEWTLAEISVSHPENIFYYYWEKKSFSDHIIQQ